VTALARAVDGVLEATVAGSFTRLGYDARRRLYGWAALDGLRLDGRVVLITGATSGLGRVTAEQLARQGATLHLAGRDAERTERARAEIAAATGATVEASLADLSLLADVRALAERFAAMHDRLDVLVHNAGGMTHDFTVTPEGNEVTLATQVLSPFLLTALLRPQLEAAAPARVIFVSSGGMYAQRLDVDALRPSAADYDGVKAYARCKRAQVALVEEWTRRLAGTGVTVNAMHPGWADTPGIRKALPAFSRALGPFLRTPEQGADTIAWLASAPEAAAYSGRFFLDRRPRATFRVPGTRRPDEAHEAGRLWALCVERTAAG
jgi:dehydrogenase/reductase SDR family protein 12